MRMPSPSAQCLPHEVDHTFHTWNTDADGGRMLAASVTRRDITCAVQAAPQERRVDTDAETGLRRVTVVNKYKVLYPANPGLNVDDLILWTEDDDGDDNPTVHTIVVQSSRNAAGLGSVWEVSGEERL